MQFATNDVALDGEVRREQLNGAEFLVAPVVAVREMVLNGGFLPFEEIERSAPGWNGVPLTVHHPEDEAGHFVSANLPEVHETHVFGRLFNVHADADTRALRGEMWVHLGVANQRGDDAMQTVQTLEDGGPLEVSTGYFMEPIPQPGTHEGESYQQVQTNLLPDHLAALPGGTGACSVEDGCGAPRAQSWGATPSLQKTVSGVTFNGTHDGSLDESAIDEDDFESHYLYPGDTKSESTYPVVDAEGFLRRGNVESAWQLGCRGQCPSDDEHRRRLTALADEFDSPPDFVEDNAAAAQGGVWQTVRHAGHVLVGQECGCGCGGQDDPQTDNDTHDIMHERIKQFLEATAGVVPEDLDDPDDDVLEALEAAGADTPEDDTDAAGETVEALQERIDELEQAVEAQRTAREQARRDELVEQLTDAGVDAERVESIEDIEALEVLADEVGASDPPFGSGVNYAGRGAGEPTAEENSEWDDWKPAVTDNTAAEEAD